ncbi:hypothetical protein L3X38_037399 [Prunus dulcis]|uniref:Uncharacterized protein n=1 Tax=Prunus dulcis TaxID=3755 RepID=A0AAD4YPH6_PRUDU|nr:hypothetical protein L3X38_037399 [Prunus dulcis]
MEESQRGNDKGKSKVSGGYKLWTLEESNELLQLMVDAANRGWRDSNGMLTLGLGGIQSQRSSLLVMTCGKIILSPTRPMSTFRQTLLLENESSSSSPLPGNEGDNVEQVFETQEQQRENANEWRVGIASDMWRNAMQDNNVTQR